MLTPLYGGVTCQPPSIFTRTNTCTQGGYPVYVVNATNVADIQAAVNFARNTGIRLVIKNTGHDFAGKSAGAGSLSVWTHHFKELAFLPDYSSSEYTGPAIKAGVGIQGYELYAAADKLGVVGMGGECPTVGVTGGWIQGGGHSPMSSLWGMGADQALGFEVNLSPQTRTPTPTSTGLYAAAAVATSVLSHLSS
jgi:FAD/FMN-containing dehydrogenase